MRKSYRVITLLRGEQASGIKALSIVERAFCEFSRRCVFVVRPLGLIWREMSLVVTADFIALVVRNAVLRFCFEIRVTGCAERCARETGIRTISRNRYSLLRLGLICLSLCQLLPFWARLLSPISFSFVCLILFYTSKKVILNFAESISFIRLMLSWKKNRFLGHYEMHDASKINFWTCTISRVVN